MINKLQKTKPKRMWQIDDLMSLTAEDREIEARFKYVAWGDGDNGPSAVAISDLAGVVVLLLPNQAPCFYRVSDVPRRLFNDSNRWVDDFWGLTKVRSKWSSFDELLNDNPSLIQDWVLKNNQEFVHV